MKHGEHGKAAKTEHTPEPWIYALPDANFEGIICGRHGGAVVDGEFTEANARRIVACVNACKGISIEDLEMDNAKFVQALRERNVLRDQRDELLAVLQSISKITGEAGSNIGVPLEHCQGELEHDEAKRLLILSGEHLKDISKAAYRAIASVKEK